MLGFMRTTWVLSPLAILLSSAGIAQSLETQEADKVLKLFADATWYKQQAGTEQVFEGVLEKADRRGAFGFGRFNPFHLKMDKDIREVYMGGQLKTLEPYVGKRVRLRGKAVEMAVEGNRHREIWPAELVTLQTPANDSPQAAEATAIERAMQELIAGKRGLEDVRLDVTWGGRGSVTIYGAGIGVWNRSRQFTLQNAELLALLKALDEGGFVNLKPSYGGQTRPLRGPVRGVPELLVGSVTLRAGDVTHASMQRGGGEQSKELAALAKRILDACEDTALEGVMADSLADGLGKLAAGKLHPLTMSLLMQRIENEGRGPNGWILRVNGRQAEVQVRSAAGISSPIRLELTDMQLDGLVTLLADQSAAELPINLYAADYTDFRVSVLQTEKSIQARKFARLTPATHGEKQKQFDRIFAALDALQQRIVHEGKRKGVSVMRQASFVVQNDLQAKAVVLRSADELKAAFDDELRTAVKGIPLEEIDFVEQMVVVVKSGRTNAFGVRVTIDKIESAADGKSAILHWTYRPYFGGAAPPEEIGNPGAIALVERFGGELTFQKHVFQWPRNAPLPPSAGPPPRIPRPQQPE